MLLVLLQMTQNFITELLAALMFKGRVAMLSVMNRNTETLLFPGTYEDG
jgi:hypothetical protein